MSGLISRQLSQYISVGSIFISCRSSTVLARVPSLAQKRAAILLRDFCDTEDHLDRKFQIYKFTFFQIKVLLPPFSIIKCNILSFIFTWYFYVSLSLTFLLCKVLPYIYLKYIFYMGSHYHAIFLPSIFAWYFLCKPEPYICFL